MAALAGLCIRQDLLGVTSVVRALGLKESLYDRIIDFFHSDAIDPDRLCRVWTRLVLQVFPSAMRINGRLLILGDGIKVPKTGRKMPAVKCLHQESENNTKPEYIMGHSCQAVSLVVGAGESAFAVPLATRIHEGAVFSNRDKRTLPGKMLSLVRMLAIPELFYFIADAYYACKTIAPGLLKDGAHLVSRVRSNAVAYFPAQAPARKKRPRGRPKMYGKKLKLRSLFDRVEEMTEAESPVYGERGIIIRYLCVDLIWKPLKRLVRFIIVIHPSRGKCIFLSTDLELPPIDIIRLYGIRFKIELSFKQALRVIGVYAYHFWMRAMDPIRRLSGDQHLHRKTDDYRNAVRRKMAAYHRYIQVGLIAQGLLQYLATQFPTLVWQNFGSWLRTIRPGIPPSELVTANALRYALPEFIAGYRQAPIFTKFLLERIDVSRSEGLRLAG